jgi:hypothetical protein
MNVVEEREIICILSFDTDVRTHIAVLFPVRTLPVRKNVIMIENRLSWKCGFHFTEREISICGHRVQWGNDDVRVWYSESTSDILDFSKDVNSDS